MRMAVRRIAEKSMITRGTNGKPQRLRLINFFLRISGSLIRPKTNRNIRRQYSHETSGINH